MTRSIQNKTCALSLSTLLSTVAFMAPGDAGAQTSQLRFGGDFNGDGIADLAIGVPHEEVNGVRDAGAVNVIYGTENGLQSGNDQFWHQDSVENGDDIAGVAERFDRFGEALAVGDFDGDGFSDLAIGVPDEDVNDLGTPDAGRNAGAVHVIYGAENGLTSELNQIFAKDQAALGGNPETNQEFGEALAVGDFNGDGFSDLAIGSPGHTVSGNSRAGEVTIIYGSINGLPPAVSQFFNLATSGIKGISARNDEFGSSLAAGDFNGDGVSDLAIGVPDKDVDGVVSAGAINVLYGRRDSGLVSVGDQVWHADQPGINGRPNENARFGEVLAAGDFNADGVSDLAIGAPQEDVGSKRDAGRVRVIYGLQGLGLNAREPITDKRFSQSGLFDDDVEARDGFGSSLAVGDYNADGIADLAIGADGEDVEDIRNAGNVNVFYGSSDRGLGKTGAQTWHQNTPGIRGVARSFDAFGRSLSAGDFDGDGATDLAIGVPLDDIGGANNSGSINVIYGSEQALTSRGDQTFNQGLLAEDGVQTNDRFGDF